VSTAAVEAEADLEQTFLALYETDAPVILRYLRATMHNDADAEDLCAEAFIRAWEAWARFSGDAQRARAWLFRIARNLVVDWSRRARRVPQPLEHAARLSIPDSTPAAVERMALHAAIAQLSLRDRELLALRAAGLSHPEIGRLQGRSQQAVKMAWHRALQRLHLQLEIAP